MLMRDKEDMENPHFVLPILPLKISLVSLEEAHLPEFMGAMLRGAVGDALLSNREALTYLYDNRKLSGNQEDIVNPIVFTVPQLDDTIFHRGESLCFEILLLGDAARFSYALVKALQDVGQLAMGAWGHPFRLMKVTHSTDRRVIWQKGIYHPEAARSVLLPHRTLQDVKAVSVRICTPLRIRRDGALLETIDFLTLIRSITRRIEALTARYGGFVDIKEIERLRALAAEGVTVRENLRIKEQSRYTNRQNKKLEFRGLEGSVRFAGDLTPFVPWLYAAQTLHIGRNTTFGMGQIDVEFV